MRKIQLLILILLFGFGASAAEPPAPAAAAPSAEAQIAGALAAAPADRRDGATVLGVTADGETVVLREGSNELICLADDPSDDRFHTACYHSSLEPWMARGRALRRLGVSGPDSLERRHQEIEKGELAMPATPATVYNLGGSLDIFDPVTGSVTGGRWVWAIYTPYATEATTGLPTTPQAPGAPWIMRPGTPSSHIMVVQVPPVATPASGD